MNQDLSTQLQELQIPKPSKFVKWRAVAAAMLVNILIGSYYVYGNINSYVAYYLKQFDDSVTPERT